MFLILRLNLLSKPNLFFENQPYVSYEKSKLNEQG